ncbi:GNAT family N-acetyltransferase [Xinfangfangia sp. CPCC 101601]|uniref:GNAT family N-acetyltransferase n=1 Tax=Pseudogemmobacter lacusdianii TaxID=3069608 RepID=A0ABU0VSN8_9RHOB|nr:GNAT family N-acetyltransferase [Xinfangfangia sp. CPCC 101601]MDQ2064754.1 GNAT family N-acetyltransferase [Xinfangfangia sp. CPCC 101601]
MQIVDARPEDAGALAQILGDWLRELAWMPILHSRDEDLAFVSRMIASHRVRVARDDRGRALGFIAVRQCVIGGFYVAAGARGQGIGKALLEDAKAVEPRLTLLTFQDNLGAIAFYTREGFVETERSNGACNEEGLPDLRMIWRRAE